jgi:hypothetical protein
MTKRTLAVTLDIEKQRERRIHRSKGFAAISRGSVVC